MTHNVQLGLAILAFLIAPIAIAAWIVWRDGE